MNNINPSNMVVCRKCGKLMDSSNKVHKIIKGVVLCLDCVNRENNKKGCGC